MLKCVAVVDGKRIDFERQPLFLGYKPLVMGVCDIPEIIRLIPENSEVIFEYLNIKSEEKVAEIKLRVDKIFPVEDQSLVLLVGISGNHKFETRLERLAFRMNQRLTKKSPSNIDLTPAEYEMLKIAYSVPRDIKVAYVMKDAHQSHFPIDLFGYAGKRHFILSLRHSKKSCRQILESQHTNVCPARATSAKQIYSWGKNHSADMIELMKSSSGSGWIAGMPDIGLGIEELIEPSVIADYGVHRLILFTVKQGESGDEHLKLVHVHRSYANWCKRQGFPLKEIPH